MSIRKVHGSWWVDLRFNGVRHRKRSPENSKAGAEIYEGLLRRQLVLHGTLDNLFRPDGSKPSELIPNFATFSERWFHTYVVNNNRPSEQNQKRYALHTHLVPVFGRFKLLDITSERVEHYKAMKIKQGLAAKTINNHLTVLRRCLNSAIDWGELQRLPRIQLLKTKPSSFHFLTPEEGERLIAAAPPGLWRALIVTGIRTGLRFSELAGLRWSDINWDTKQICVQRSDVRRHEDAPKTQRLRHLPMTSEVVTELSALPRNHERVFTYNERPLCYNTCWGHMVKICRDSGLSHTTWKDLRHSFASNLVAAGAPLKAVQDLMGHSTIEMTMRYSHLNDEDLRKAISLLEKKKIFDKSLDSLGYPY